MLKLAEEEQVHIHINLRAGKLITPDAILCFVDGQIENCNKIQNCFVFSSERTFEKAPIWGFIVLGEATKSITPCITSGSPRTERLLANYYGHLFNSF